MTNPKVVIYTKKFCPYCEAAKRLLREEKVSFEEIDTTENEALRAEIEEKSGQQTVPQIFINGKSLGGHIELEALEKSGELDRLLGLK